MGYDVTFHPVSLDELNHFLFEVIERPGLLEPRLAELIPADSDREVMRDVFLQAFRAIEAAEEETGITPKPRDTLVDHPDEDEDTTDPQATVRFLAAMVAGFVHPYWYSRGAGIFLLDFELERGESYQLLTHGRLSALDDDIEGIAGNYSAGCFISPDRVKALRARVDAGREQYRSALGDRGFDALTHALYYACSKGLGLIEATDVVVPSASVFMTRPDLMRAHYLNNVGAAVPSTGSPSKAQLVRESAKPDTELEATPSGSPSWPFFAVAVILGFLAIATERYFLLFPALLAAVRGITTASEE